MSTIFLILVGGIVLWYLWSYLKDDFETTVKPTAFHRETPKGSNAPKASIASKVNDTFEQKVEPHASGAPLNKEEPKVKKDIGKSDDFTRIGGIGPKIATLLKNNDVGTYRQLAEIDVSKLSAILQTAGVRVRNSGPEAWTKQAKLAADADWDGLTKLQKRLAGAKKGRIADAA